MINKLADLHATISRNSCDIAVITESWLSPHIPDDLIGLPNFAAIRRDRPENQRGGGLCTYINNNLNFLELAHLSDPQFETQWFLLKPNRLPRGINSIIMVTVYHPPQNKDNLLRNHLFQSLDTALTEFPNAGIIILGDFNQFKPGSLCSSFKLKKLVNKPTRGVNILDQAYSTLLQYYNEALILPPIGMSDHLSVLLNPKKLSSLPQPTKRILRRDSRPSNKHKLFTKLSQTNWTPLYYTTSCNDKVSLFTEIISQAMDSTLPMRNIKIHPSDKPWINPEIKDYISKRQRAWLIGHTQIYTFYRNKVNKLCKNARRTYFTKRILNTQDTNPKKWWSNIKQLAGFAKSPGVPSLFHNGVFKRGVELADTIAESFCKVTKDILPLKFTRLPVLTIPDEFIIITSQQVEYELSQINTQKSSGPDEIPNWLLKTCAPLISDPISSIFNSSIAQGFLPNDWKSADVLAIPKIPKPKSVDEDLRPISLTSVLSKILERFVFRWLSQYVWPHIDHYQYGNIKNSSTTHALIHLIHHWLAALETPGNTIRSCMIDFSKAFDRVDHNILLAKLLNFNVPNILMNWCANFLEHRHFRVKMGKLKSDWKEINAGVPQGTILAPFFFLIMINDLTTTLPLYKYVDDCTAYEIISRSTNNATLQTDLNNVNTWTETNNMRLNVKKTKEFRVSFLKTPVIPDQLTINNIPLDIVKSFKLLGITITSDLTWNIHVDNICAKASNRLYALRILKRNGVPVANLLTIFCTFIRPVLEYACQVWHTSLPSTLSDQIEHVQKRALKIVYPHLSYTASLGQSRLITLQERRENQCLSLYKSVLNHDNKLHELLPDPVNNKDHLRNPRKYPLFKCRTERFKNSFIPYCVNKWDTIKSTHSN